MPKHLRTSIAVAAALAVGATVVGAGQTAPTPASAATTTASTAMPVGNVTSNGRRWIQVTRNDFTKSAARGTVPTAYPQFGYYDGFKDTSRQGLYAPKKVLSAHSGVLDFWMHAEHGQPLGAVVIPENYTPRTTARVSIRFRTTNTVGYKFVGMLWPSSNDWNDGEIDWPEFALGGTAHPASAVPGSYEDGMMAFDARQGASPTGTTGWHIATTEWDKKVVRFYWDNRLVAQTTKAVPKKPMRVTLQAETLTDGRSVPKNASGHIYVDWISVWK